MFAFRLVKTNALEFHAFLKKHADIFKTVAAKHFRLVFRLSEENETLRKDVPSRVVEVIEVKMRHDHGVDVKEALKRNGEVRRRIPLARHTGVREDRIGVLRRKHRVDHEAHAREFDDGKGAADLLEFHGCSLCANPFWSAK